MWRTAGVSNRFRSRARHEVLTWQRQNGDKCPVASAGYLCRSYPYRQVRVASLRSFLGETSPHNFGAGRLEWGWAWRVITALRQVLLPPGRFLAPSRSRSTSTLITLILSTPFSLPFLLACGGRDVPENMQWDQHYPAIFLGHAPFARPISQFGFKREPPLASKAERGNNFRSGPGATRTRDLLLRRQALYPTELRTRLSGGKIRSLTGFPQPADGEWTRRRVPVHGG